MLLSPEDQQQGNHYYQLCIGGVFFDRVFADIEGAKKSIYLETFIYTDDATGWELAELLVKKARAGCDVRVIVDRIGMIYFALKNPRQLYGRLVLMGYLQKHGVLVHWAGSLNPFLFKLDHRKLVIIDDAIGYTGGMNIGNEYRYHWHDAMLRMTYPWFVESLRQFFLCEWKGKRAVSKKLQEGEYYYGVLATDFPKKDIEKDLRKRIRKATTKIWIQVAYMTDPFLIKGLVKAAKRGVDVHIIIPKRSNHFLTRVQHFFILRYFMKKGILVYAYNSEMMHLKLYSMDDAYVSFGTANATFWSMNYNKEVHVCSDDPVFVHEFLEKIMAKDQEKITKMNSYWRFFG